MKFNDYEVFTYEVYYAASMGSNLSGVTNAHALFLSSSSAQPLAT